MKVFQCDKCKSYENKESYRNRSKHHSTVTVTYYTDYDDGGNAKQWELCSNCHDTIFKCLNERPAKEG